MMNYIPIILCILFFKRENFTKAIECINDKILLKRHSTAHPYVDVFELISFKVGCVIIAIERYSFISV